MPGLVPGIPLRLARTCLRCRDGRGKPGHDEMEDHELRFTSARNAFTGFSLAGTRLRNASCSGAVLAWKSFIMAGGICTTSMTPSVRRFKLSLSALSDSAQKSGSSFFASSSIAFWCAGENFFHVSLLTLTIWHDQV